MVTYVFQDHQLETSLEIEHVMKAMPKGQVINRNELEWSIGLSKYHNTLNFPHYF